MVKPDNQLQLTEEELAEEHTTMLTANDPEMPSNVAVYVHKERAYKAQSLVSQTHFHFRMDGWLLHSTSDEAKRQVELDKAEEEARRAHHAAMQSASASPAPGGVAGEQGEGGSQGADAGAGTSEGGAGAGEQPQELSRNQFNFTERAAQTQNTPTRDRETFTDPPPLATYSAHATQWAIYDAYLQDQEEQRLMKEQQRNKDARKAGKATEPTEEEKEAADRAARKATKRKEDGVMHTDAMRRATKVVERMANQNSYADIAEDFKYWEDRATCTARRRARCCRCGSSTASAQSAST